MITELYHHGIKGQKWGVRRYQNPDGTLTSLGKARLRIEFSKQSKMDKEEYRQEKSELKKARIKKGLFNDSLKKGSSIYRYSSAPNESIDNRRKYVSITDTDKKVYKRDAEQNVLSNNGSSVYLYNYTANKNLKIAKGDKVVKDLIKTYGDESIKTAYKESRKTDVRKHYHKLTKELQNPEHGKEWMFEYASKNQETVNRFLHKTMYDSMKSAEIYKKYSKKGYDAIVDPEDYIDGYYYPLILLNPKSSVSLNKVDKVK